MAAQALHAARNRKVAGIFVYVIHRLLFFTAQLKIYLLIHSYKREVYTDFRLINTE